MPRETDCGEIVGTDDTRIDWGIGNPHCGWESIKEDEVEDVAGQYLCHRRCKLRALRDLKFYGLSMRLPHRKASKSIRTLRKYGEDL